MDQPAPTDASASATLTPPPLPSRAQSFRLHYSVWIGYAIFAAVRCAVFYLGEGQRTAYATGKLAGELLASLLIPLVLALVVWRVAGRSRLAGNITFAAVLGLSGLGQITAKIQTAQAAKAKETETSLKALKDISAERRKIDEANRKALANGKPIDDSQSARLAEQTSKQLADLAQNSNGDERMVAEASRAYLQNVMAAKKRYDEALAIIDVSTFFDLNCYFSAEHVARRREGVKAFVAANEDLKLHQDFEGTAFRRELEKRKVSGVYLQGALEGYRQRGPAHFQGIAGIRRADARLANSMEATLDLIEANLGKWKLNEEKKIVFDTEGVGTRYNQLVAEFNEIAALQEEIQRKLLAAPGKK